MNHAVVCTACDCSVPAPGSLEAGRPVCSKCFSPMATSNAPNQVGTERAGDASSLTMVLRPGIQPVISGEQSDQQHEPTKKTPLPDNQPTSPATPAAFNPSLTMIVRPATGMLRNSQTTESSEQVASSESNSNTQPAPTAGTSEQDGSPSLTTIVRPSASAPATSRGSGTVSRMQASSGHELAASFQLGELIDGRYLITKRIGQGGMGAVYKVVDQETETELAIKVLLPSVAASPDALSDLRREVSIAQQLTHQNLIRVNHLGIGAGQAYLVMEFIDGEDLEAYRLRQGGKLQEADVRRILSNVLAGLGYLHDKGTVHLDIKPQNVMVPRAGDVKLADFGISRTIKQQLSNGDSGQVSVGTLSFMAPEQIRGEVCDRRADLYAVGILLHLLLVGELPFSTESREAVVAWHLNPQFTLDQLPPTWEPIVRGCLARRKEDRTNGCTDLIAALSGIGVRSDPGQARSVNGADEEALVGLLVAGGTANANSLAWDILSKDRDNRIAEIVKLVSQPGWTRAKDAVDVIIAKFKASSATSEASRFEEELKTWCATELARAATELASELDALAIDSVPRQGTTAALIIEGMLIALYGTLELAPMIGGGLRVAILDTISRFEMAGIGLSSQRMIELTSDAFFKDWFSIGTIRVEGIAADATLYLDSTKIPLTIMNNVGSANISCKMGLHQITIFCDRFLPYEVRFTVNLTTARTCMFNISYTPRGLSHIQAAQYSSPTGWSAALLHGSPGALESPYNEHVFRIFALASPILLVLGVPLGAYGIDNKFPLLAILGLSSVSGGLFTGAIWAANRLSNGTFMSRWADRT